MKRRKIGVVGFGHLGQHLVKCIQNHPDLDLVFVWNRSPEILRQKINSDLIIQDLTEIEFIETNLIVETAHPEITKNYGEFFLKNSNYLIGSPTALADSELEAQLKKAVSQYKHSLYIPTGALWGGEDIKRMADNKTLKGLKITMSKHPHSFKLNGYLKDLNNTVTNQRVILYNGSVRELCPFAPNNVNTMAAAAIIGHTLGFDGVVGCLIADSNLTDYHIVEVEVTGPETNGKLFKVHTIRRNPSKIGHVTGEATYNSFFSSVLNAHGKEPGIHLC